MRRSAVLRLTLYRLERLALRWVQKYVHLFGGDPERVILYVCLA